MEAQGPPSYPLMGRAVTTSRPTASFIRLTVVIHGGTIVDVPTCTAGVIRPTVVVRGDAAVGIPAANTDVVLLQVPRSRSLGKGVPAPGVVPTVWRIRAQGAGVRGALHGLQDTG